MKTVIVGRILQGLGGGGIDVLVSVILADMTTLCERSKYLGLMAIPSAIGTIMGPFVGAFFSTYLSWRWIGWINLPLLGLGGLLVLFFLNLRTVSRGKTLSSKLGLVDWTGMILFITGITALCVPVSWAGSLFQWASWQTLLPLTSGVALLAFFSWYESKPSAPVVPHRLFKTKTGNAALIGGFVHGMILTPLLQYLPLLYQAVFLRTAISSAVYLLPTVIMSALVTAASMMLVSALGGYVMLIRTGWCIAILGIGLLTILDVQSSDSMLYGLPILWGQGVSMLRILMLPIQASVKDVNDEGLATANFLTIRMFGALLGLAACSPIFAHSFSTSISKVAFEQDELLTPLKDAHNAVNFIENLRTLNRGILIFDQVLQAYLVSFRAILYTMAVLSALGLLSSMFLAEISLKRERRGNQSF
jgi:MFS family permease